MENNNTIVKIIKEELVPALGCTEPISVALGAATARKYLDSLPDNIHIRCSGNLIKNIKCVKVPNTKGMVGIESSVLAGLIGGNPEKAMEVLSEVTDDDLKQIDKLKKKKMVDIDLLDTPFTLHFILRVEKEDEYVEVEIKNLHTNIVRIEKNGTIIKKKNDVKSKYYGVMTDRSTLSIERIIGFAKHHDTDGLKHLFSEQIRYNTAIAEEGLNGDYGVSIGKAILKNNDSVFGKMKAYATAASEARMCGCTLPVITNSGSGNQGLTSSIPVIVYARENHVSEEKMLRALALSNLLTIYQKTKIGRLSAFCGVISSACSAGAALTYLEGGSDEQIGMTIVNALEGVSGVICDGAKASCAAKIAAGLESAFIGHLLAMEKKSYQPFTGFIRKNVDDTIEAVARIASEGMKDTDKTILDIMMK